MDVFSEVSGLAMDLVGAHLGDVMPFLDYGSGDRQLPKTYRGKGRRLIFRFSGLREESYYGLSFGFPPLRKKFAIYGDVGISVAQWQEYENPLDIYSEDKNPTQATLQDVKLAPPESRIFRELAKRIGEIPKKGKIILPVGKRIFPDTSKKLREEFSMAITPDFVEKEYYAASLHFLFGYAGRGTELEDKGAMKMALKFENIFKSGGK